MAIPERDNVYNNTTERSVYTRESNGTGWFVGIIVVLALLAIGYLVFSANSGPTTPATTNNTPAVEAPAAPTTEPAPMTEAPAPTTEPAPMTAPTDTAPAAPAPAETAPATPATPAPAAPTSP